MTDLTKLQRDQLDRITTILTNMGCTFAIIMPDGNKLGDLDVVEKKRTRAPSQYARNELRDYILPYIWGLLEGQIASIPHGKYDPVHLQSYLTSYACRIWGNGSYTTTINKDAKTIDILRTGGI